MILPHGGLELGSTTTTCVGHSRPGGEAVVVGCASLGWPAGGWGEIMNDTPLVLKGCMTVVALSLILQYVVHSWSKLKGRGGGGKVRCHWRESTCRLRETLDGGGTLLLKAIVVVILLLLVIAGDVENKPRTRR